MEPEPAAAQSWLYDRSSDEIPTFFAVFPRRYRCEPAGTCSDQTHSPAASLRLFKPGARRTNTHRSHFLGAVGAAAWPVRLIAVSPDQDSVDDARTAPIAEADSRLRGARVTRAISSRCRCPLRLPRAPRIEKKKKGLSHPLLVPSGGLPRSGFGT